MTDCCVFSSPQVWEVEANELEGFNFGLEHVTRFSLVQRCAGTEGRGESYYASLLMPTQCQMCLADWPIVPSAFGPLAVRWTKGRAVSVPYGCHLKARHLGSHASRVVEAAKPAFEALQH